MLFRFFLLAAFALCNSSLLGEDCDPIVEYRSATVERIKTGWPEYQQSNPPEWKIYKTYTQIHVNYYDRWYDAHVEFPYNSEYSEYISTGTEYTVDPDDYSMIDGQELGCSRISAPQSVSYIGSMGYYHSSTYRSNTTITSCTATMDSSGIWDDPECESLLIGCSGTPTATTTPTKYEVTWDDYYDDGNTQWYCWGFTEDTLSDEYTTDDLVSKLKSDLDAEPYSEWVQGYPTAWFHLKAPYNKCGAASKFEARIFFTAPDGVSMTIHYTLRTNWSDTITYGHFSAPATSLGGGQYMLEVPEVVAQLGTEIDLIDAKTSFEVTLTKDKSVIYGKTTAPVSCNLSTDTSLTITATAPAECIGLVVESIEPLTANTPVFVPPNNGTLQYSGNKTWTYTSWTEPQSEKYARAMKVKIKPINLMTGQQAGPSIQFTVKSAYEHIKDQQNWPCAYEFVTWRYAAVLAIPNAEFNNVYFDNNETISCGFTAAAIACTTLFNDVTFAADAFNDTENAAASTVGHELLHTIYHLTECPSYTWEVNNASGTGLDSSDNAGNLQEATGRMTFECDE